MKFTNEDVQEILDLLDATSFDVLHLQTERFKLTLRRQAGGDWTQESQVLISPHIVNSSASFKAAAEIVTPKAPDEVAGTIAVRAALPGTFYRAARPGAPPFVKEGSRVQEDTVVGIVETMKLMNAIHAGVRGTVTEITIENAQFAEQGAVLMRIKLETA
jgi:acetyl-CoA carboxylase biotin carboxyl carrier protein